MHECDFEYYVVLSTYDKVIAVIKRLFFFMTHSVLNPEAARLMQHSFRLNMPYTSHSILIWLVTCQL